METTVTLRPPFEYSPWVFLVGIVIFVLFLILFIRTLRKVLGLDRKKIEKNRTGVNPIKRNIGYQYVVKEKYIMQIQALERNYRNGKINQREGFQTLSLLIRGFVHDVTGINVETATMRDVKKLGIKHLDTLMEEYYVPEFAEDGRAIAKELSASCATAVGVIKTWT